MDLSAHMLLLMNVTSHSNILLEKSDTFIPTTIKSEYHLSDFFLTVYSKQKGRLVSHFNFWWKEVFDDNRALVTGQKQDPAGPAVIT